MERQQLKEVLRVTIRVSQNLYFAKIKIMMKLFVYAVFGSVTAHQEIANKISKDRNLALGSIKIAEQVETL